MSTSGVFSNFQQYLDEDYERKEEIRTVVRELEQTAREIQSVMQAIHQTAAPDQVLAACKKADPVFARVKQQFSNLSSKIPVNQYYSTRKTNKMKSLKFNDQWRFVIQRLAYLAALKVYLSREELISQQEAAETLGVKVKREDGFHMDLDDFLMGLLIMASELSRFAVNAVVSGDPSRPIKVSRFLAEMDSGFRLLNLKNDMLRKKFDSLKYSVQKVEGVVYDLTIRSLVPTDTSGSEDVSSKD